MNLHPIVSEDPRYVDLMLRFRELDDQKAAHSRRREQADAEFRKAQEQYNLDLSRAIGNEEFESLVRPERPPILDGESVRSIAETFVARRAELEDEKRELLTKMAEELVPVIRDKKRESRESVRELLRPLVSQLRDHTEELNALQRAEHVLRVRARTSAVDPGQGIGSLTVKQRAAIADWSSQESPRELRVSDLIADVLAEPGPPLKERSVVTERTQRRLARQKARSIR